MLPKVVNAVILERVSPKGEQTSLWMLNLAVRVEEVDGITSAPNDLLDLLLLRYYSWADSHLPNLICHSVSETSWVYRAQEVVR